MQDIVILSSFFFFFSRYSQFGWIFNSVEIFSFPVLKCEYIVNEEFYNYIYDDVSSEI